MTNKTGQSRGGFSRARLAFFVVLALAAMGILAQPAMAQVPDVILSIPMLSPQPLARTGSDTAILAFTVLAPGPDTLTGCTVVLQGVLPLQDIETLNLYLDSNKNGRYDSGIDTFMAPFNVVGGGTYAASVGSYLPSGQDSFVVVFNFADTAGLSDSFQAQVPTNGVSFDSAGAGPGSPRLLSGSWTVEGGGAPDSSPRFMDGSFTLDVDAYSVSETASIQVTDSSANTDTQVQDTIIVTVNRLTSGENENVLLTEINIDASVFRGTLPLSANPGDSPSFSGLLFAQPGDTLIVTYGSANDSVVIGGGGPDTSGPNAWYVNDTSPTGDVFTAALGADTANGLAPSTPKRTIGAVLPFLTPGDTVYIDAGFYPEAASIVLTQSNVCIQGKDSASTVISFGDTSPGNDRMINATGLAGITIRDLAVERGYNGIRWSNVDSGLIERVRSDSHGSNGLYLENGCDWNRILSCVFAANGGNGGVFVLGGNNTFNAFSGNLARNNVAHGFNIQNFNSNLFEKNVASKNVAGVGFIFSSCGNNLITANLSIENIAGFHLSLSNNNMLTMNQADSNAGWAFSFDGTSSADTFQKNVVIFSPAYPDSGVDNAATSGATFDFTRNWWGTTDSVAIRAKIGGTSATHRNQVVTSPYRLGPVDTALGADTVAPNAPGSVSAEGISETVIRVTWSASIGSEEPESSANLIGHRVWRTTTYDSAARGALSAVAQLGPGATTFDDSGLTTGQQYFYRVTAFDNAPIENQSYFSGMAFDVPSVVAEVAAPPGDTAAFDTVVAGALGGDTAVNIQQNDADTLVLDVASDAGETWTIRLDLPDTGNRIRVRAVPEATLGAGDTSRIEAFAKGENLTLEITAFDSAGFERDAAYWQTVTESPVLTFEFGASGINPNRAILYWFNTDQNAWYDVRDPVFGMTRDSYTRTETMISIPVDHFSHFFPGEGTVDTVTVVLADSIAGGNLDKSDSSRVTVLSLLILGDTFAGDTLQSFMVANLGNIGDTGIDTVALWHSADGDSAWSASDTLVSVLVWGGGDWRQPGPLGYFVPWTAAETFIVTIQLSGAANAGETFHAYVPAYTVKTELEDTGPIDPRVNPGIYTIVAYDGPNWYVNDTDVTGDVYTSAFGSDTAGDGSETLPFATIAKALTMVSPGETVYIDAGTYWPTDTIVIPCSYVTLIGKDSAATVIDFNNTANSGARAIYAKNVAQLVISDLKVQRGMSGIWWVNVDSGVIRRVAAETVSATLGAGVHLATGSSGNLVESSQIRGGGSKGIQLSGASANVLAGNLVSGMSRGFYFELSANGNVLIGNTARSNSQTGFEIYTGQGNTLVANVARGNSLHGFFLDVNAAANILAQNVSDSNVGYQFRIYGTFSGADSVEKNVVITSPVRPDSGVLMEGAGAASILYSFRRSFWMRGGVGTTDSALIRGMIQGAGADSAVYAPWRLGIVDTAPGADTVAPGQPTTLSVGVVTDSTVSITWAAPVSSEEDEPVMNGAGFRVWRSPTADTSLWVARDTTAWGTVNYTDSGLTPLTTYYYRVTTYDNATPYPNESFYSDSILSATTTVPAPGPNIWYVNDTSLAGDSFTSAIGYDTADGLSSSTPKRTLNAIEAWLTAGDTVYIDAGTYYEPDTVTISCSNVALVGVDSALTVIDFNDTSWGNARAVHAINVTGISIQSLRVTRGWRGIFLDNADSSMITLSQTDNHADNGVALDNGASGNTLVGNFSASNGSDGFMVIASSQNVLTNNRASGNSGVGFTFTMTSIDNTMTGNQAWQNGYDGFAVAVTSTNNLFLSCVSSSNGRYGFFVGSDNNIFRQNTADSNGEWGIYVDGTTANITFNKNIFTGSPARPDSGVFNNTGNTFDFTRNWWGTTDSAAIKAKIWGTGRDSVVYTPWRLGLVDTAVGADTVAPNAPATVSATPFSDTVITVTWTAAVGSEEPEGAPGQTNYFVYRSPTADTSLWVKIDTVTFGTTTYSDSNLGAGLLPVTAYYYRVTTVDAASNPNESFFSDSIAGCTTTIPAPWPNIWYVNDTSLAGDSFTSAIGYDTADGLSAATPKQHISAVTPYLTPGDTILIDAGTYTETVVIETDAVSLVGVDSVVTIIDPPGGPATAGLYAVYADTQTQIRIASLRLTGAYDGIRFVNVDSFVIADVATFSCGEAGIYLLNGCDSGLITHTQNATNSTAGIYLDGACNDNVIEFSMVSASSFGFNLYASNDNTLLGNRVTGCGTYGYYINVSNGNVLSGNVASLNGAAEFHLYGSNANQLEGNRVVGDGTGAGIRLENSDSNTVRQNDVLTNETGILLLGLAQTNVIQKNNFSGNVLKALENRDGLTQTITRNWWNSMDSAVIAASIVDTANDFTPYRLDLVDTAPGADTVAPNAPDSVSASAIDSSSILVSWTGSVGSEEPEGAPGQSGYIIYRSPTADTSLWVVRGQIPFGTNQFVDSELATGSTWYYRVTVYDANLLRNQSFYSDSIAEAMTLLPVDTTGPNIWYVNDTSLVGDSFTAAIGEDANHGLTAGYPKRTLAAIGPLLSPGDTVLIDAGLHYGMLTVDTDYVTVQGADSTLSIINGAPDPVTAVGIYVPGATGVVIRDLQFIYGDSSPNGVDYWGAGILLEGATNATISGDSFNYNHNGLQIDTGCDSNIVENCRFSDQSSAALLATAATRTTLQYSAVTGLGVVFGPGSDSNTVNRVVLPVLVFDSSSGNTVTWDTFVEIQMNASSNNVVTDNNSPSGNSGVTVDGANNQVERNMIVNSTRPTGAIEVLGDSNLVRDNTISGGSGEGIRVSGGDLNLIESNTIANKGNGASKDGFLIQSGANFNVVRWNSISGSARFGILIAATADTNLFTGNSITAGLDDGVEIEGASNVFANNLVAGNTFGDGVSLYNAADNEVIGNQVSGNRDYAIRIIAGSTTTEIAKNNLLPSGSNPDSALYTADTAGRVIVRNWWGTTDSAALRARFAGPGADSIAYIPFRLDIVDTAPGADTVAPAAPDSVSAEALSETAIRVAWSGSVGSEEAEAAAGQSGYIIYRSPTADTSLWVEHGQAAFGTNEFIDSGLTAPATWYYRVTVYDGAVLRNQSFYSDSTASAFVGFLDLGSSMIFVYSGGDGSSPTSGDPLTAYSTIDSAVIALESVNGWDTIVVYAAAGGDSYGSASTRNLETGLVLISAKSYFGADTGPGGDTYPIITVASPQPALTITGDTVTVRGFDFQGNDLSAGHIAVTGSVLRKDVRIQEITGRNWNTGVNLSSGSGCVISAVSFETVSIGILIAAQRVESSTVRNATTAGIRMTGAGQALGNTVSNAVIGIDLTGSSNDVVDRNVVIGCTTGIKLPAGAYTTPSIRSNLVIGSGSGTGLSMGTVAFGLIAQNEIRDVATGMAFNASNSAAKLKNSVIGCSTSVTNNSGGSLSLTRFWWGTTDSSAIAATMAGANPVVFTPFRLDIVDTAPGADTVAPNAPDTVLAAALSETALMVIWAPSVGSEEAEGAAGQSAYIIFRSPTADTSLWVEHGQVAFGTNEFFDSGLAAGETWYYRVTVYDGAALRNQSFYSDSIGGAQSTPIPDSIQVELVATTGKTVDPSFGALAETGVLAFRAWTTYADTLELVSVIFRERHGVAIDSEVIDTATLYLDADLDAEWTDGVDTFVAYLQYDSTSGAWQASGLAVPTFGGPDSRSFVATLVLNAANVVGGETLQVEIPAWGIGAINADSGPTTTLVDTAVHMVAPTAAFLDTGFNDVDFYAAPDTALIVVEDMGANLDAGSVETATAMVTNTATGETELVALTEIGMDSGIFIAEFFLSTDPVDSAALSGALYVQDGDVIELYYSGTLKDTADIAGASFASVTLLATAAKEVEEEPETTVLAFAVYCSDADSMIGVSFRFIRRDGNSFAAADLETVALWVDANQSGELEVGVDTFVIALFESAGAWQESAFGIPFAAGDTKNFLVGVELGQGDAFPGETFTLRIDAFGLDFGVAASIPASDLYDYVPHEIVLDAGFTDSTYAYEADEIVIPDTLYIYAADFQANIQPGGLDTVAVAIVNLTRPDTEWLSLTETGIDEGVFTGELVASIDPADSIAMNGFLYAQESDVIALYYDGFLEDTFLAVAAPTTPMVAVDVDTAYPAGGPLVAAWQETTVFLVVRIEGDTTVSDTLTSFRVAFNGNWDSSLEGPISLYEDINFSNEPDAGDVWVGDLTPLGNGGFELATPYSLDWQKQFLVVGHVFDTAPIGETLQAYVKALTVKTERFDSGPATPLYSAGTYSFIAPPPVSVSVDTSLPAGGAIIAATAETISLISVFVQGDTTIGDTLGLFRIVLDGDAANIETIELWNDQDMSHDWTAGDTFVATMTPVGGGVYEVADAGVWLDVGGLKFAVVGYVHDTATVGETFQVAVPAYGVKTARFDTAPATSLVSPALFTINPPPELNFVDTPYYSPDTGFLVLIDTAANTDTSVPESVWIDVSNLRTGETESIEVQENGTDVIVFLGPVLFSDSVLWIASMDGVMYALPGDTIQATYAGGAITAEAVIETAPTTFVVVHQNAPSSDTITVGVTDTISLLSFSVGHDTAELVAAMTEYLAAFHVNFESSPGLDSDHVALVQIYRDLDRNGAWSAGDEFVAGLSLDPSGFFGDDAIYYALSARPESFVVVMWGADTTPAGETIQAFIPAGGVVTMADGVRHLPGPAANLFSPAVFTTAAPPDTTAPSTPSLLAPAHAGDTNETLLEFSWTASTDSGVGLAGYQLQFDTSANFAPPRLDTSTTETSLFYLLPANDTWYWRVVAVDSATNTSPSIIRILRVDTAPPSTPGLLTPADAADTTATTITFSWSASTDSLAGMEGYRLEIATDSAFGAIVFDSTTAGTSIEATLGADLDYFWRVTARDLATNATFVTQTLRVSLPPAPPIDVTIEAGVPVSDSINPVGAELTSVIVFTIGGDPAGDTLIRFHVAFTGAAGLPTGIETATLYRNAARDGIFDEAVDEFVAALPSEGAGLFGSNLLAIPLYDWMVGADSFIVVVSLHDTAVANDTLRATVPAGQVRTTLRETGPAIALSSPATFTVEVARTDLIVDPLKPSGQAISPAGADMTALLAFSAGGGSGDTLTGFTVELTGGAATAQIDTVWLAVDVDQDGNYASGTDSIVGVLAFQGAARYALATPFALGAAGAESFVVVVSLVDTAPGGDTLQASVPALAVKVATRDSAPLTATAAPGVFLVESGVSTVVGVSVNPNTVSETIAPIGVDLTRVMAFAVRGEPNDTLTYFTCRLDGAAGAPSRLDYVVLYRDANNNGNYDSGVDPQITLLAWKGGQTYYRSSLSQSLGASGTESFLLVLSYKDSAPSGETVHAVIPALGTKTALRDTGPAIEFKAPAAFTIFDLNPPSAFSLASPATNSDTNANPVILTWNASADPGSGLKEYRIQISRNATFSSTEVNTTTVALGRQYSAALAAQDTYWWRVIASDVNNNARSSTETFHLRIDRTGPSKPTLSAPAASSETTATTIGFSWTAATDTLAGISRYRLQIASDPAFSTVTVDSATGTNLAAARTLASGAAYYWRVLAEDKAGNTTASDSRRLAISSGGPSTPNLLAPADLLETSGVTLTFRWDPSTDSVSTVTGYRLQIDTALAFLTPSVDAAVGLDTSSLQTLAGNRTWYWRVLATNASGLSTASAPRTLVLDSTIAASLFSPADGVTTQETTIHFVWVSDGDTFEFQLGADTSGAGLTMSQSVAATTLTPDTPLANGMWYWRVLAADNAGNRETSTWFALTIDTTGAVADSSAPASFELREPAAGAWSGTTAVTLRWYLTTDTPGGVAGYIAQASADTTFAALVAVDTVAATRETAILTLPANDTYYWRVIAFDGAGNARLSNTSRLVGVDTAPPSAPTPLVAPATGEETSVLIVAFRWSAAADSLAGVDSYRIQVDTDAGFGAPRLDSTLAALTVEQTGLETGLWYWRVATVDGAGNFSSWATDTFRIIRDEPGAPAPLTPPDTYVTSSASETFTWSAATPASSAIRRYHLEAARDSAFGAAEKSASTADTATTTTLSGLTAARWYWRVRAEDMAGNFSLWSTTATFLVDSNVPATPSFSSPAVDRVARDSSVTCTWTVASTPPSGIAGYRLLIVDSAAATVLDSFFATAETTYGRSHAGLDEGWHTASVWMKNGASAWSDSASVRFGVDVTPPVGAPTLVAPVNGAETTVTSVTFTAATGGVTETGVGGAAVALLFQTARTAAFDPILTSQQMAFGATTFTPTYVFGETGTYFWRVAAVDTVGNVGADSGLDSFVRPAPADTTPPVPVANLDAVADDNLGITLTWVSSPSADMAGGGQYNVYWNEGRTNATPDTLIKIVAHVGTETYAYRVHDDQTLANGTTYSFKVRAQDNVGNVEDNNAAVSVAARLSDALACYGRFITPQAGQRVNKTGGIQIVVQIENAVYRMYADTLTLYYRRVGVAGWTAMSAAANAASVNPMYIGGDSRLNIGMHWDADSDGVAADTQYELRALVTDKRTGQQSTSLSVSITVEIVGSAAEADMNSSNGEDTGEISQKVDSRRDNEIEILAGDGAGGSVDLPSGSLDPTTDTSDARAVVKSNPGRAGGAGGAGLAVGLATGLTLNTALGTDSSLTNAVTVELPGGQATLLGGQTATIATGYAVDSWGFIQTYSGESRATSFVSPDTRNVRFYFVPTGGGARELVDASTLSIDTMNRRISGRSARMGTFIAVMHPEMKGLEIAGAGFTSESRALLTAVRKDTDASLAARLKGDTGISIVIYDLSFRTGGSAFSGDVHCTIPMPTGYTKDSNFVAWTYSGGTLETATIAYKLDDWIVLKVAHFSVVTLVVPAVGAVGAPGNQANLDNLMIYPNPYRPNDGNPATGSPPGGAASRTTGIVFDNLPANTKVEIYTLRGERVFEQVVAVADGWVWWNVRNAKSNEDLASGYYIYVVTDQATGQRKTGKLAVIR